MMRFQIGSGAGAWGSGFLVLFLCLGWTAQAKENEVPRSLVSLAGFEFNQEEASQNQERPAISIRLSTPGEEETENGTPTGRVVYASGWGGPLVAYLSLYVVSFCCVNHSFFLG